MRFYVDGDGVLERRRAVSLVTKGTFTRSGEGSHLDGATLAWAASDVARREDRSDSAGALLLLERSSVNLTLQSENFSATWGVFGTPVLTGGQLAPDGASDAYQIQDDNAGNTEGVTQNITVAGSTAYALSLWIKKDANTARFAEVHFDEVTGGSGHVNVQVNTSTGATLTRSTVGLTNVSHGTISVGDWWVFWIRFTTTGATTNGNYVIFPAIATTWGAVENAAQGSIIAWGAQLETGRNPTSTIRTSTVAVMRGADTKLIAAMPSWFFRRGRFKKYSPTFASADLLSGDVRWLFTIGDANNGVRLRHDGANVLIEAVQGGAVRAASQAQSFARHAALGEVRWDRAGRVYVGGVPGPLGTAWTWTPGPVRFGGIYGGSGSEADARFSPKVYA
jgi:hypothetical protein